MLCHFFERLIRTFKFCIRIQNFLCGLLKFIQKIIGSHCDQNHICPGKTILHFLPFQHLFVEFSSGKSVFRIILIQI